MGVDGVSIDSYKLEGQKITIKMRSLLPELTVPFDEPFTLVMVIEGLSEENYKFIFNDSDVLLFTSLELSHLRVVVYPDGKIIVKT